MTPFAVGRSVTSDMGRFRAIYRAIVEPTRLTWTKDDAHVLLWWMPTVPIPIRRGDILIAWASPDGIVYEGVEGRS